MHINERNKIPFNLHQDFFKFQFKLEKMKMNINNKKKRGKEERKIQ